MRYVHRIIVMKNIIQRTSECWISHLVRIREAAKKTFFLSGPKSRTGGLLEKGPVYDRWYCWYCGLPKVQI